MHGNPDHLHHDQQIWHPQVIQISALRDQGVDSFWAAVSEYRRLQTANGRLASRRQSQARAWMWERIDAGLAQHFRVHPQVQARLPQLQADVVAGKVVASAAARELLAAFTAALQGAVHAE